MRHAGTSEGMLGYASSWRSGSTRNPNHIRGVVEIEAAAQGFTAGDLIALDVLTDMMNTKAQHDEEKLDETLDETFPASDPPANTVEIGIRTGESAGAEDPDISDNRARSRFELTVDGHTAFLVYERTNDTLTIVHTEVPTELRGHHLGERLVDFAMNLGRNEGLRTSVVCPFARLYLRRHPPSPTR